MPCIDKYFAGQYSQSVKHINILSASFCLITASCTYTGPRAQLEADSHSSMSSSATTSNENGSPMQTSHDSLSATMTAEDVGKRVLKLVASINGAEDISPENIERVTGLKIDVSPTNPHEYGTGGKISDTFFYNLGSLSNSNGSKPNRLMFSFDDQSNSHADMTPVCSLDFSAYAKQLSEAGYASNVIRGEHNRVSYWDFSRGKVSVQVYIRGESDEKADHDCVSKLIINT